MYCSVVEKSASQLFAEGSMFSTSKLMCPTCFFMIPLGTAGVFSSRCPVTRSKERTTVKQPSQHGYHTTVYSLWHNVSLGNLGVCHRLSTAFRTSRDTPPVPTATGRAAA